MSFKTTSCDLPFNCTILRIKDLNNYWNTIWQMSPSPWFPGPHSGQCDRSSFSSTAPYQVVISNQKHSYILLYYFLLNAFECYTPGPFAVTLAFSRNISFHSSLSIRVKLPGLQRPALRSPFKQRRRCSTPTLSGKLAWWKDPRQAVPVVDLVLHISGRGDSSTPLSSPPATPLAATCSSFTLTFKVRGTAHALGPP